MKRQGICWMSFSLGTLFERSTTLSLKKNLKNLDLSTKKDSNHKVALISASRNGSGCMGFLNQVDYDVNQVSTNKLTFDDQWGYTYFQDSDFIITGGHNAILEVKNQHLKEQLNSNIFAYKFISMIINKITVKSNLYGYNYKINSKFDREIILLPIIEVVKQEDSIWCLNEKYYTLNFDYIAELLDKVIIEYKRREEDFISKTKLEENERLIKLKSEQSKYIEKYNSEQKSLLWMSFRISDLFQESTEHYLEKSKKNYQLSEIKTDEYCVAVCAASKFNNGIVGYIRNIDDVPIKRRTKVLTKSGFGHVFYQSDWFVKPGGSWGMLNILNVKNQKLRSILDLDATQYLFISKLLTKIFTEMTSYGYAVPIEREIVILPLTEVIGNGDYIWMIKNKKYTFASATACYLYWSGQVKNCNMSKDSKQSIGVQQNEA